MRLAKNGLVTIVTRAFESFEKKSCGICDNDFSALPENISQGLVAIVQEILQGLKKNLVAFVTRGFESFEKNLVAFVTTTFQLCLKIFHMVLGQL